MLLVLSFLEVKAQLSNVKGATGSTDPHLPAESVSIVDLMEIKMIMRKTKKVLDTHTPPPTKKMITMIPLMERKKRMIRSDYPF